MSESKKTGLALLREPFPDNQISLLPKPYKKDSEKGNCKECGGYHGLPAVHLKYVGHAALTDRLLDVDPSWTWEPLAFSSDGLPLFDKAGGLWIKLTILSVTRLGYGNAESKSYMDAGAREKEVIGDCLRNAAMRFGAALDLWHKGDLHGDDDKPGDKKNNEAKKEKPFSSPHKPVDGAFESLSEDDQNRIRGIAIEVIALVAANKPLNANKLISEEGLNNDERIALWSQFDSKVRSALKKAAEEKRLAEEIQI